MTRDQRSVDSELKEAVLASLSCSDFTNSHRKSNLRQSKNFDDFASRLWPESE
jgi:hypothetical protein